MSWGGAGFFLIRKDVRILELLADWEVPPPQKRFSSNYKYLPKLLKGDFAVCFCLLAFWIFNFLNSVRGTKSNGREGLQGHLLPGITRKPHNTTCPLLPPAPLPEPPSLLGTGAGWSYGKSESSPRVISMANGSPGHQPTSEPGCRCKPRAASIPSCEEEN